MISLHDALKLMGRIICFPRFEQQVLLSIIDFSLAVVCQVQKPYILTTMEKITLLIFRILNFILVYSHDEIFSHTATR